MPDDPKPPCANCGEPSVASAALEGEDGEITLLRFCAECVVTFGEHAAKYAKSVALVRR